MSLLQLPHVAAEGHWPEERSASPEGFGKGHAGIHGTACSGALPSSADRELLKRIDEYILSHLASSQLNGEMLQRRFRLSRRALYRLFEDRCGVARHIRACRLDVAHELVKLIQGHSITHILHDLGFTSERQFQRAFHARFGLSPQGLRRQTALSNLQTEG